MKIALVGHRGIGKTSLLKQIQAQEAAWGAYICLDEWIEKNEGRAISEIFLNDGEAEFRKLEKHYFAKLQENSGVENLIVALGAGFEGTVPDDFDVIWVRRKVNAQEFIFLDRPVLDDSYQISLKRFEQREKKYKAMADRELFLSEGVSQCAPLIADYLFKNPKLTEGILTWRLEWPKSMVKEFGCTIELRDDLLENDKINEIAELLPPEKLLYSSRRSQLENIPKGFQDIDCATENNTPPQAEATVVSSHGKEPPQVKDKHLKWSPEISSMAQLKKAAGWWQEDAYNRSLLPRSANGRWSWFRLKQKNKQKLNFFSVDQGSAKDQPTWLEWQQCNGEFNHFAAIIGAPVAGSQTPNYHRDYFAKKNANVFAIECDAEDWSKDTLEFLRSQGLRWAAVTSPLKSVVAQSIGLSEPVNTVAWDGNKWVGISTDSLGLKKLLNYAEVSEAESVAVWGGGGVLDAVKKILNHGVYYSARTGLPRSTEVSVDNPGAVLWAQGYSSFLQTGESWPETWSPRIVMDMNYQENSPARVFALRTGAKYVSGLTMFYGQAAEQQNFWSNYNGL